MKRRHKARRRKVLYQACTLTGLGSVIGALLVARVSSGDAPQHETVIQVGDNVSEGSEASTPVAWPTTLARDLFGGSVVDTAGSNAVYTSAESILDIGSILYSDSPRALINGVVVGEGDVIAGFRVHRIDRRTVIVEKNGVRVHLGL
jgi:hypothetical protein